MWTDSNGNPSITGTFDNTNVIFGADTLINNASGSLDIFLARYDISGNIVSAKSIGGPLSEISRSMTMDTANNVLICGSNYNELIVGDSTYNSAGAEDMFVAKYGGVCTTPVQPGSITGNTTVCQSSTNVYSILPVTGASSYTWTTPSWSGSSTVDSIVTTARISGGIIPVTANNICGASVPQTLSVTATPSPTVTASAASDTICSGTSTTITAGGASTYVWHPGAGLSDSTIANPNAAPSSSRTYTVTGTAGGCSATALAAITVNTTPTVTAAPANITICSGASTTLTAMVLLRIPGIPQPV